LADISVVVITGLSGAGKSVAANSLEDLGYYTIDNLPLVIIEKFIQIIFDFNVEINKVALVIDSRSKDFDKINEVIKLLKEKYYAEILFLTSDEQTIINRYKETRRKHPLGDDLVEAIRGEKESMVPIQEISDIVLDTSGYNVHDLSAAVEGYFKDTSVSSIYITVQSFGFKYGVPTESDLVLDVRFLKNPHFSEALRDYTGLDDKVKNYIFQDKRTKQLFKKLKPLFDFLVPNYVCEGKKFLTISIGCTGGKHRSVAIAEEIGKYLRKKSKNNVYLKHRDIDRS
jgi:UPF0042 nucleotide-binding protein